MHLTRRDEKWLREEIPLPLPREEVEAIYAEFQLRREQRFRYTMGIGVLIAVMSYGSLVIRDWLGLPSDGWQGKIVTLAILIASVYVVIQFAGRLVLQSRFERMFREILRERGHEVCGPCGYCLVGLGEEITKCPECGAEREPMPEVKA